VDNLSEHIREIQDLYFVQGWTYERIGIKYHKSREAVRKFLDRNFPERKSGVEYRRALEATKKVRQEAEDFLERTFSAPPCVICYKPVIRRTGGAKPNRTCSPVHADLWKKARYWLDDGLRQRQRISMANCIISHSDKKSESTIAWAYRVIDMKGKLGPAKSRDNSQAYKSYQKVLKIRAGGNERKHHRMGLSRNL